MMFHWLGRLYHKKSASLKLANSKEEKTRPNAQLLEKPQPNVQLNYTTRPSEEA